jgi:predicted transcriptional regulator
MSKLLIYLRFHKRAVLVLPLIVITRRHIRAARALLGLSQEELARRAYIALRTLSRLEESDGAVNARTATLNHVVAALEKAGVDFLDEERPGVRLKKK